MLKIESTVSTASGNDQVKAGGKDYVYVKEVWAVCVCVATMLQKTKSTKLRYISNEIIGYIFIYNKCKCNVDCIKLSKCDYLL